MIVNSEYLSIETASKLARIDMAVERIKALIIFWKKYTPDNTMEIRQLESLLHILEGKNENKSRSIFKIDK